MKPIREYPKLVEIMNDVGIVVDSMTPVSISDRLINVGGSFDQNPLTSMVSSYFIKHEEESIVFRFMPTQFAISSLQQRKLRVYNLLSQNDNDFAEASEFFLRSRLLTQLCPSEGENDDRVPTIEQVRENVHILCFSKILSNNLWHKYGKNKGCCLVFKAKWMQHEYTRFADVLYGADELFDKINYVQSNTKRCFNRQIFIPGIHHFALLYKRMSYNWENEIRYVLTPNKLNMNVIADQGKNKWGQIEERKYCEIPFNSSEHTYLNLELLEVLTGTEAEHTDVNTLNSLKRQVINSII